MADVDVAMTDDFSFSISPSFVPNGLLTESPFVPNGLLAGNPDSKTLEVPDSQTQGAPPALVVYISLNPIGKTSPYPLFRNYSLRG
jgi:hypothetical protein